MSAELDRIDHALAPQIRRERGVPAASLTTWRVGGPIEMVAHATSTADVVAIATALDPSVPVLVIGRGSNLLVADAGFPGVAIMLEGDLDHVRAPGPGARPEAHAGGAVALPVFARKLSASGWGGLEFYVGIPGSVGGAVAMNAGGHGRETSQVLVRAEIVAIDERTAKWREVSALDMSYRHSALTDREVVVSAVFAVEADDPRQCLARVEEVVRWRRANQPGGANAGSVFRNPPDDSAGRLIDASGLKHLRIRGASVSEKHANFIQTEPGATAADVLELIRTIARLIFDRSGVTLQPEVRMVGFEPHDDAEELGP